MARQIHTADGHILWYPDRKFFLLGKRIPGAMLAEIPVPRIQHT